MSKLVLRIAYVVSRTIFMHKSRRCELRNVANSSQSVCKLSHVPPVGFSCPGALGWTVKRTRGGTRDSPGKSSSSRETSLGPCRGKGEPNGATELFLPARLRLGPPLCPCTVVTPEAGGGARPSSRRLPGQAQERRPWGLSRVGHKSAGLGLQVAVPALSPASQVLESRV